MTNSNLENKKIAQSIEEAKKRLKDAKPEKVIANTQKAKSKRGY